MNEHGQIFPKAEKVLFEGTDPPYGQPGGSWLRVLVSGYVGPHHAVHFGPYLPHPPPCRVLLPEL